MSVRGILVGCVLCFGAGSLVTTLLHVKEAHDGYRHADRFVVLDRLHGDLRRAGVALAEERGRAFVALSRGRPVLGHETGVAAARAAADRALRRGLDEAERFADDEPSLRDGVGRLRATLAAHDALRARIDRAGADAPGVTSTTLASRWFDRSTRLIDRTRDLRFDLWRSLPIDDRDLLDGGRLMRALGFEREFVVRRRDRIAGLLAGGRRPAAAALDRLTSERGGLLLAREIVDTLAVTFDDARVLLAVLRARRLALGELDAPGRRILDTVRRDEPSPMTAEAWLDGAARAVGGIAAAEDVAAARVTRLAGAARDAARGRLILWSLLGLLGTAGVAGALVVINRRVARPLAAVARAMTRLAAGDLDTPLPQARHDDETAAMIRALAAFKSDAIRRTVLQEMRETLDRAATEAVRAKEVRLRAVFENVADGIITLDPSGRIEDVNPAVARMFGRAPDDLIGDDGAFLFAEERRPAFRELLRELAAGRPEGPGGARETVALRADGTRFPLEIVASGAVVGYEPIFIAAVRDITERKAVERMKGEFIATVSHELRTPLTSIRGALGLLSGRMAESLPAAAAGLVTIATRNAERLIALVNDILDVERIESGRLEFVPEPVDLVQLLREAVEANQGYAADRGVSLRLDDGAACLPVTVDPGRVLQVLANLVSNAAKFTPAGGAVVVAAERLGRDARVTVHDDGPGIPEDFKAKVFRKFAQADGADTRKQGGTGLGLSLSISKAIVERHGGRIWFTSEPGSTDFRFTVPLDAAAAAPAPNAAPDDGAPAILVCEDDPDVARLLRTIIEGYGYRVDLAGTAAAARAALERRRYAAMTLDLVLPDEPGTALLRSVRERPATRDLPVIVVSAAASAGADRLNGDAIGVVDWIDKPAPAERLERALGAAVRAAEGRRPAVLHVEDDRDVLLLVARLLHGIADVVPARSLAEAASALDAGRFDLVILDLDLRGENGLDLVPRLTAERSGPPVVVFAASEVDAASAGRLRDVMVKSRTGNDAFVARVLRLLGRTPPRFDGRPPDADPALVGTDDATILAAE